MAKDKNTYAKRQRETLKRQKAEEKKERRRKRKEQLDNPIAQVEQSDGENNDNGESENRVEDGQQQVV